MMRLILSGDLLAGIFFLKPRKPSVYDAG